MRLTPHHYHASMGEQEIIEDPSGQERDSKGKGNSGGSEGESNDTDSEEEDSEEEDDGPDDEVCGRDIIVYIPMSTRCLPQKGTLGIRGTTWIAENCLTRYSSPAFW